MSGDIGTPCRGERGGGQALEPDRGRMVEHVAAERLPASLLPYRAWMTRYGLLGKFSAQPGKRDELVGYLLQAAQFLERNDGCVHYVVSTSDEPEAVWVSEVWIDEAAHEASLEPADIRALIQQARPLIAGMSDRTRLTVHGGKGLPG